MVTILKPGGIVIYSTLDRSGFNVAGEISGFTVIAENVGLQKDKTGTCLLEVTQLKVFFLKYYEYEKNVIDANSGVRVLVHTKRRET